MNPVPPDYDRTKGARRGDYEVGYGRPPVATRFRAGGVGNPKGRPKQAKTVGQIIEEAMMTLVKFEVNGKIKTMTAQEVIIRSLVRNAARGDTKAVLTLYALKDRYQNSEETVLDPSELETNDRKIIEEYLGNILPNGTDVTRRAAPGDTKTNPEQNMATDGNARPDGARE